MDTVSRSIFGIRQKLGKNHNQNEEQKEAYSYFLDEEHNRVTK